MPVAERKRAGRPPFPADLRNDYAVTINFPIEVENALEAYRSGFVAPPSRAVVVLAALKMFLAKSKAK